MTLYMERRELPLPTLEEVLVCDEKTTAEEVHWLSLYLHVPWLLVTDTFPQVILLWRLALKDPECTRVFCVVYAEKLLYHVADEVFHELTTLVMKCNKDQTCAHGKCSNILSFWYISEKNFPFTIEYRLVIVCSKGERRTPHIVSKLYGYQRALGALSTLEECNSYLMEHFCTGVTSPPSALRYVHRQLFVAFSFLFDPQLLMHSALLLQIQSASCHLSASRNGKVTVHWAQGVKKAPTSWRSCHYPNPWSNC